MNDEKNTPLSENDNIGDSHTDNLTSMDSTMVFTLSEDKPAGEIITEKADADEEVKVYKPGMPKAPEYDADPDSPVSRAASFDIDEILKNLGIEIPEYEEKSSIKSELEDISSGPQEDDSGQKTSLTRHFKLPKKQEMGFSMGSTRRFNLDESLVTDDTEDRLAQKRKNLIQNFRVLSKTQDQDQAILETASSDKAGKSIIDLVDVKKGEDIFQAVEKATGNQEQDSPASVEKAQAIEKQKLRKKKKKEALATGKNLHHTLESKLSGQKIQLIVFIVLLFLTFILTILPDILPVADHPEFLLNSKPALYALAHILILAVMSFIGRETLVDGFDSLRYMSPDHNTGILLMTGFSLLSDLCLMIGAAKGNVVLNCFYTLCVVFALTIKTFGEYLKTQTAIRSLITVMKSGSLESIQPVEDSTDAAILSSGIPGDKNSNILYCAGVDMNENLVDDIGDNNNTRTFYSLTSLVIVVFGLVAGTFFATKGNNFVYLISILLSSLCLCFPVMNTAVSALLSMFQNQKLNSIGAAATEYEGIRCVGKASAVTMDVSDLFCAQVSRFRRVRGASISQSDAAVFAAATLSAGKSIVAPCFDSFISELGIDLPEAETLQYEERLGFSCWIAGRRVLVGNRQMLINHSIAVPTEAEEKRYAGKCFAYYVVVEGETIATFLVDYKVIGSLRKISPKFNKTGLVLILTSKEASLSEKVVSSKLAIEMAAVKILSGKGTDIMTAYRRDKFMRISNGLICSKKNKSLLELIISSHNLYTANKLFVSVTVAAQIMGLILLLLAMVLNMSTFFNPITIVFLHLLWSVAVSALCLRKLN